MISNLSTYFSLFLNNEEPFIEFNTNILETNLVNIILLICLLLYANKVSFSLSLKERQVEIVQTIENAQKDVVNASNYYFLAEKGFTQSLFWLQSWRSFYEKEKLTIVTSKYEAAKKGIEETFDTSEKLITNLETKAFYSLQRYIIFVATSKILREFFSLSTEKQSKLVELTISKFGEAKK